MKKLKALPGKSLENMAIIKQKMPEKKHLIIGICLCFLLAFFIEPKSRQRKGGTHHAGRGNLFPC